MNTSWIGILRAALSVVQIVVLLAAAVIVTKRYRRHRVEALGYLSAGLWFLMLPVVLGLLNLI